MPYITATEIYNNEGKRTSLLLLKNAFRVTLCLPAFVVHVFNDIISKEMDTNFKMPIFLF